MGHEQKNTTHAAADPPVLITSVAEARRHHQDCLYLVAEGVYTAYKLGSVLRMRGSEIEAALKPVRETDNLISSRFSANN